MSQAVELTVRIPRRLQELQSSIASVRPRLVQDLQRDPTLTEPRERRILELRFIEPRTAAAA